VEGPHNYLPLVLDAFTQLAKADGYIEANGSPARPGSTGRPTAWTPGRPVFTVRRCNSRLVCQHPARDTGASDQGLFAPPDEAVYADPDIDDWPMMALDVNGPMLRLC